MGIESQLFSAMVLWLHTPRLNRNVLTAGHHISLLFETYYSIYYFGHKNNDPYFRNYLSAVLMTILVSTTEILHSFFSSVLIRSLLQKALMPRFF